MATFPRNARYRNIFDTVNFQVDAAVAYNEGDLMVLDATTKMARPITAASDAALLIGDSLGTNPIAHHSAIRPPVVGINCSRHSVKLVAKEAAAFTMMTPVYFSVDAQSFQISVPAGSPAPDPIGYLIVDPKENPYTVSSGNLTNTTVVGNEYEVLLRPSVILA